MTWVIFQFSYYWRKYRVQQLFKPILFFAMKIRILIFFVLWSPMLSKSLHWHKLGSTVWSLRLSMTLKLFLSWHQLEFWAISWFCKLLRHSLF